MENRKREKFDNASKKRLKKIAKTKVKTSFIGALDAFEKGFGHLWGHDLDDEECTDEQNEMYEIWDEVRNKVLDKGNDQLRSLIEEIDNHDVHWLRHQVEFRMQENYDG